MDEAPVPAKKFKLEEDNVNYLSERNKVVTVAHCPSISDVERKHVNLSSKESGDSATSSKIVDSESDDDDSDESNVTSDESDENTDEFDDTTIQSNNNCDELDDNEIVEDESGDDNFDNSDDPMDESDENPDELDDTPLRSNNKSDELEEKQYELEDTPISLPYNSPSVSNDKYENVNISSKESSDSASSSKIVDGEPDDDDSDFTNVTCDESDENLDELDDIPIQSNNHSDESNVLDENLDELEDIPISSPYNSSSASDDEDENVNVLSDESDDSGPNNKIVEGESDYGNSDKSDDTSDESDENPKELNDIPIQSNYDSDESHELNEKLDEFNDTPNRPADNSDNSEENPDKLDEILDQLDDTPIQSDDKSDESDDNPNELDENLDDLDDASIQFRGNNELDGYPPEFEAKFSGLDDIPRQSDDESGESKDTLDNILDDTTNQSDNIQPQLDNNPDELEIDTSFQLNCDKLDNVTNKLKEISQLDDTITEIDYTLRQSKYPLNKTCSESLHQLDDKNADIVGNESNSDESSNEEDDTSSDDADEDEESIDESEVDAMLEKAIPETEKVDRLEFRPNAKHSFTEKSDETPYFEWDKLLVDGVADDDAFEVLPDGWIKTLHIQGIPVYLHRRTRVCTLIKPYFIGSTNCCAHRIPTFAIPCLEYKKKNILVDGEVKPADEHFFTLGSIRIPRVRIETDIEHKDSGSLDNKTAREYYEKLFKFRKFPASELKKKGFVLPDDFKEDIEKTETITDRPSLPTGTNLISFIVYSKDEVNGKNDGKTLHKREWNMNPRGRTYVAILHEFLQHSIKVHPLYRFDIVPSDHKKKEKGVTHLCWVTLCGEPHGEGVGRNKRIAKLMAAKDCLQRVIPELKGRVEEICGPGGVERETETPVEHQRKNSNIFDEIKITDHRVIALCNKSIEPMPYSTLLNCLRWSFGQTRPRVEYKPFATNKVTCTLRVGKHEASFTCKNKRIAKQCASQQMLQLLHPELKTWGDIIKLYGHKRVKPMSEKRMKEQEITMLQGHAKLDQPNYALLDKLSEQLLQLHEKRMRGEPIHKFPLPEDDDPAALLGSLDV